MVVLDMTIKALTQCLYMCADTEYGFASDDGLRIVYVFFEDVLTYSVGNDTRSIVVYADNKVLQVSLVNGEKTYYIKNIDIEVRRFFM